MRYLALSLLFMLPVTAYAGNIKDTDLISSNTFFLPPSTHKTVFIQARNSSDNQDVSFHDLGSRLVAKGYQVVNDPDSAQYIVLANIVYCNITKPEMPVEAMVASGYGSAFNTTMGAMQGLASMASMAGPYGAMGGAAARRRGHERRHATHRGRQDSQVEPELLGRRQIGRAHV